MEFLLYFENLQSFKEDEPVLRTETFVVTRLTYNCAHLRSTKESLTDSVKNLFVRKNFCVKIFLGENLLGEHFLSEHFFWVKFFG